MSSSGRRSTKESSDLASLVSSIKKNVGSSSGSSTTSTSTSSVKKSKKSSIRDEIHDSLSPRNSPKLEKMTDKKKSKSKPTSSSYSLESTKPKNKPSKTPSADSDLPISKSKSNKTEKQLSEDSNVVSLPSLLATDEWDESCFKDEDKISSTGAIDEIFGKLKATKEAKEAQQKREKEENEALQRLLARAASQSENSSISLRNKAKRDPNRRYTEDGLPIYTPEELGLNSKGGDTSLCPFDCDCCF